MFTKTSLSGPDTGRTGAQTVHRGSPSRRLGRTAWRLAALVAAALAVYLLGADPALAQSDIGSAGDGLLTDLGSWILVGTVGGGIFAFIKGRTALGFVVLAGGVLLWGITSDSSVVQGLADSIWGIFGG